MAILERDADTGARTVAEIADARWRGARGAPATCASAPTARRSSPTAVERFGGVDVLVNNAQQVPMGPLDDCTDDDMLVAWESGALAAFRLMQLCHPLMTARGGGAIVNLASGAGTEGLAGLGAYAVAKEGIRALTKVAMREWGVDDVRVNTVCPWARTDYWDGLTEREQQARVRHNPLRRIGEPEEIGVGGGVPRQRRRRVRDRPDHPRRRRQHGVPVDDGVLAGAVVRLRARAARRVGRAARARVRRHVDQPQGVRRRPPCW